MVDYFDKLEMYYFLRRVSFTLYAMIKRLRKVLSFFKDSRRPGSVKRIIYKLPKVSIFRKYYNQDEFFDKVDRKNWTAIVDGFQKRFVKWYFTHMKGEHASYMDFCALCALVEIFSYYSTDKDWHNPSNYKEFLRELDPVFRSKFSTPILITRCEDGVWKNGKLKDFADVFYAGVRCSLHHHGDLASFAGMSSTGKLAKVQSNAGESLCGKHRYPIVIFDPAELKKRLQVWLANYCDDLRTSPDSDEAKQFRNKFRNDFGIEIPAAANGI